MRKYLILFALLMSVLTASAQDTKTYRMLVHHNNGEVTAYTVADVDYVDFEEIMPVNVTLDVKETADSSITVTVTMPEECSAYNLAIVPFADFDSGANLTKYFENNLVGKFTASQDVKIENLTPGTEYMVLAQAFDKYGKASGVVTFKTSTTAANAAPKVGDYYYSDGTWSDGGLISISTDGTNPVWATVKPSPVAGKTVIGIVCQTDQNRIAEEDKKAGYTHGYVLACKNAAEPGRNGGTTRWVRNFSYEGTKVKKLASSWYASLSGRTNTKAAIGAASASGTAPEEYAPAFYYSSTGFGVEAPTTSSGWFLPSAGQLWDALANFLGNETAKAMKDWQTLTYDASYYCKANPSGSDPISIFNSIYSLVPVGQKDVLKVISEGRGYTSLWTSDRYDTESACQFNFGVERNKNMIEGMIDWYDGDAYARPMLAF